MIRRVRRSPLAVATLFALAACGDDPVATPRAVAPTVIRLESDPDDYIGRGRTYEYTQANAYVSVRPNERGILVRIDGDQRWEAYFYPPDSLTRLQAGTWTGLSDFSTEDPGAAFLEWFGDGVACGSVTGGFTVDSAQWAGNALVGVDLRFEQRCGNATAALRGTIRWRRDDPTRPPGPVLPVPADLWQPPAGATPATGNFLYLESDSGETVARGRTILVTPPTTNVQVIGAADEVRIQAGPWSGTVEAMESVGPLAAGYYPDVMRWPFHNPAKGGSDWSGEGGGCNTSRGWFVVDRIARRDGVITALELRFEQRCTPLIPALRGKLRWGY